MRRHVPALRARCRALPALLIAWCGAIHGDLAHGAEIAVAVDDPLIAQGTAQRLATLTARFAPTRVAWPAGRVALADAVRRLADSGNPTRLGIDLDGATLIDLPAFSGDYWQGVEALCATADLALMPGQRPMPGHGAGTGSDVEGHPIAVQMGAVELMRRDPAWPRQRAVAAGMVRMEFPEVSLAVRSGAGPAADERTVAARVAVRIEPRIDARSVGAAGIAFASAAGVPSSASGAVGRALILDQTAGETSGNEVSDTLRLTMRGLSATDGRIALSGTLTLVGVQPWRAASALRIGDQVALACGGGTMALRLIDAAGEFANGKPGPGLGVAYPVRMLFGEPHVRLLSAGRPLRSSSAGGTSDGETTRRFLGFADLAVADYEVVVNAAVRLGAVPVPVTAELDLGALPADERAPDADLAARAPSRLSWPAGRATVQDAVGRLAAGGNQVLIELGADERRSVDLPAFAGTFWEAVLVIARACDLAVLPPPLVLSDGSAEGLPAPMEGGPLTLGERRPGLAPPGDAFAACGPVLVQVVEVAQIATRDLSGANRRVEVGCRLRLEPRIDAALVGACSATWNSLADHAGDRPLTVAARVAGMEGNRGTRLRRRMRGARAMVVADVPPQPPSAAGATMVVQVDGLPPGPVGFAIGGQAQVLLQRETTCTVSLPPDGTAVAMLGARPVHAALISAAKAEEMGMGGNACFMLSGPAEPFAQVSVLVTAPSGAVIRTNGGGGWYRNGQLWYVPLVEAGVHTVHIAAIEVTADLRLPFAVPVWVP